MHTAHGAVRGAGFFGDILPANVLASVLIERFGRIAALLRAVMHQAVLANVHVTGPGPAAPPVGCALGNGVLEVVQPGEMTVLQSLHLMINRPFALPERTK